MVNNMVNNKLKYYIKIVNLNFGGTKYAGKYLQIYTVCITATIILHAIK